MFDGNWTYISRILRKFEQILMSPWVWSFKMWLTSLIWLINRSRLSRID